MVENKVLTGTIPISPVQEGLNSGVDKKGLSPGTRNRLSVPLCQIALQIGRTTLRLRTPVDHLQRNLTQGDAHSITRRSLM